MSNHLLPTKVANAASTAGQARPVAYETPVTCCANTELGIVSGHRLQGFFLQVAICLTIGQSGFPIKPDLLFWSRRANAMRTKIRVRSNAPLFSLASQVLFLSRAFSSTYEQVLGSCRRIWARMPRVGSNILSAQVPSLAYGAQRSAWAISVRSASATRMALTVAISCKMDFRCCRSGRDRLAERQRLARRPQESAQGI